MTAVTMINPFAPQPVQQAGPEAQPATQVQALPASDTSNTSQDAGTASDQSGAGAGNGTGTGGAQIGLMLNAKRAEMSPQDATPKSVVEAQSEADPAAQFLERKSRQRADAAAAAEQRAAESALAQAEAARQEAARAVQKASMPDPLPTAPILQG